MTQSRGSVSPDVHDRIPPTIARETETAHTKSVSSTHFQPTRIILGMTIPALVIITFLLLSIGSAGLFGWLKIPGLNNEVKRLKGEINRLSTELNRLESENDRYESLNDQLNETVIDLEDITENLNSTVTHLTFELNDVTYQLNVTNQDLQERVSELTYENERYSQLNMNLTAFTLLLKQDVVHFKNEVHNLVIEVDVLSNLTSKLGNLTLNQDETLTKLQETLANFTSENDRLVSLNADIVTVVGFLNETSLGFETSLQAVTDVLSKQIIANQVLLLGRLENTYRQRIAYWDCDYRDAFREFDWGNNYNLPIMDLDSVIAYLNDRVFSVLCWDALNFKVFLNTQYPDGTINSYRLISGVINYAEYGLEFYFPESDEVGLTTKEWSEASYSCKNLANKYLWTL